MLRYTACVRNGHGKRHGTFGIVAENPQTEQMTMSIYNAMERGADAQVSGVIGTLQSAIAQINTPELMYIFGGDDLVWM